MRLLIDTDVILDVVLKRQPFYTGVTFPVLGPADVLQRLLIP